MRRKNERLYHFMLAQLLIEHDIKINIDCLVYAVHDDEEFTVFY